MDNPTSASAVSAVALKGPYVPTPPSAVMGTPDAASYLNLSPRLSTRCAAWAAAQYSSVSVAR